MTLFTVLHNDIVYKSIKLNQKELSVKMVGIHFPLDMLTRKKLNIYIMSL